MSPASREYYVRDDRIPKLHLKVTPNGNKSFLIRYRNSEGKQRKFKIGNYPDISISQARSKAQELLSEVGSGKDPFEQKTLKKSGVLFKDYAEQYYHSYAEVHLKPSTLKGYRQILDSILIPTFGSTYLTNISSSAVRALHEARRATPYQANRAITVLTAVFRYAEENGDLGEMAMPNFRIKPYKENSEWRLLDKTEISAMADAIQKLRNANPHLSSALDAITFIFFTGARRTETLTLRWDNIDFERRTITFANSKSGTRYLPISVSMEKFLRNLHSFQRSEWLFPSASSDGPLTDPKKTWIKIKSVAGIKGRLRLHDIRHTVISDLTASADPQTAQNIAGHKSLQSTLRYIHAREETVLRALEDANLDTASFFSRGEL